MTRTSILLAFVALVVTIVPASAGAGGGAICRQTITDGEPLAVSMEQSCFGPEVTTVAVGDTVSFVNNDPYPHTVTGAGLAWGSVDMLQAQESTEVTFDTPGVFPYMCILHAGMAGVVVVEDAADGDALVVPPAASEPEPGSLTPADVEPAGLTSAAMFGVAAAGLALAGAAGIAAVAVLRRRSPGGHTAFRAH